MQIWSYCDDENCLRIKKTPEAEARDSLEPIRGQYQNKTKQPINKTCEDSESLTLSTASVRNDLAEKLRELGIWVDTHLPQRAILICDYESYFSLTIAP